MFIPAPIFGGISEKEANFVDKVVRFVIDFPTWTLIGIALAALYGTLFIDEPASNTTDSLRYIMAFFHTFIFFSLLGLYKLKLNCILKCGHENLSFLNWIPKLQCIHHSGKYRECGILLSDGRKFN